MYTYIYIYIYIHTHTCRHIRVYIYVCIYVYMYIHIYTHTCIYIYTYMYTDWFHGVLFVRVAWIAALGRNGEGEHTSVRVSTSHVCWEGERGRERERYCSWRAAVRKEGYTYCLCLLSPRTRDGRGRSTSVPSGWCTRVSPRSATNLVAGISAWSLSDRLRSLIGSDLWSALICFALVY